MSETHHHDEHAHDHSTDPHDVHAEHHHGSERAFRASILLNIGLVILEGSIGLAIGSMVLLADAAHNLSDVLGLLLGWVAARLALRRPSERHTYGLARSTILAALANAALLLFTCGILFAESVQRLGATEGPPGPLLMIIGAIAAVVNFITAQFFAHGHSHDLNQQGARLHLLADAAVSVAVVVVGGLIWLTGWHWLDAACGIALAVVIAVISLRFTRQALALALDGVPERIDLEALRVDLLAQPGVAHLHDLHVWGLSTTVTALTVHIEAQPDADHRELLGRLQNRVTSRWKIGHATFQIEQERCAAIDCNALPAN